MSQVPVSMQVIVYPRDKSVKPYPATIVGYAWLTGLGVGGGPMPGGGGDPPHVDNTLPPIEEPPPIQEPPDRIAIIAKEAPPGGGWGFSIDEGWFYAPGSGSAGPKRR